jgi:septal ring factor EnvC (AmiA/AmiB activator)
MAPEFFDMVKPDGAGWTGRTVKTSGLATVKKIESGLLILADTFH